jgi:hypothetical protein
MEAGGASILSSARNHSIELTRYRHLPVVVTVANDGEVPRRVLMFTEGEHLLSASLTLFIEPVDRSAGGQGQRGYRIRKSNADGTKDERSHSPLARGDEPFVAFYDTVAARLWFGSPSVLAWHDTRDLAQRSGWVNSDDIPKEIAANLPKAFRAAAARWYPKLAAASAP